jgi:hypothetical protein
MIRSVVLIVLAVLAALPAQAQSLAETKAWILEQHQQSSLSSIDMDYELDDDGNLICQIEWPYIGDGGTTKRTVSLKEIDRLSFAHTDKYLSFKLYCKDDAECMYQVDLDNSDKFKSERRDKAILFEIYAKVDATLAPRMQKAFLHLIKLSGGNAKAIANEKKKEAF